MNSENNKQGYLEVGDGHSIYFETYGNPKGIDILFIHGGPGGHFTEEDKQFFDPQVFNVIFFDQRGTGRSKPLGDIKNNTTQKLIEDITKLLNHLQVDKVILFGGSWGCTLSLLYSIEHPNKVSTLVLRGIFTASKENRQHFENGGTELFFPKIWKRYAQLVPDDQRTKVSDYYFDKILSSDDETRKKYSYELVRYGLTLSQKDLDDKKLEHSLESIDVVTSAVLQSHYSINNFFIPDNYILDNLENIGNTPTYIVQGRYDMITPPKFAIELVARLQNASLFLVNAGHSAYEADTVSKLTSILDELG